jgi:hypothetical protein
MKASIAGRRDPAKMRARSVAGSSPPKLAAIRSSVAMSSMNPAS